MSYPVYDGPPRVPRREAEAEEETIVRLGQRSATVTFRGESWYVHDGEGSRGRRFLVLIPEAEAEADDVVMLADPAAVDYGAAALDDHESGVNFADMQ